MTTTIVIILVIIGLIALAAFIIASHMVNKEKAKSAEELENIEHGESKDKSESKDKIQFKFTEEILYEETDWDRFLSIMRQYSDTLTGHNQLIAVESIKGLKVHLYLEDADNETYINEIINYVLSYEHLIPDISNIDFVINSRTSIEGSIRSTSNEEIKTLNYKRGK